MCLNVLVFATRCPSSLPFNWVFHFHHFCIYTENSQRATKRVWEKHTVSVNYIYIYIYIFALSASVCVVRLKLFISKSNTISFQFRYIIVMWLKHDGCVANIYIVDKPSRVVNLVVSSHHAPKQSIQCMLIIIGSRFFDVALFSLFSLSLCVCLLCMWDIPC